MVADESAPTSFVEIVNTVFEGNQSFQGGAILADRSIAPIRLECVTFRNNNAVYGGAIATNYDNVPYQFNGTIRINNSNFINNTANRGGAINREGGSIVIGDNHWSPDPSATPTASNSVVGMPAPPPNDSGEFPLDCEVPEPPTEACLAQTAGASISGNIPPSIRFSPEDSPEGQNQPNIIRIWDEAFSNVISLRPSEGIQVTVMKRNTGFEIEGEDWWWYVEITLDDLGIEKRRFDHNQPDLREYEFKGNEDSIKGWMVSYAIEEIVGGCDIYNFDRVPIVEYIPATEQEVEQIIPVEFNPIYDYELELPIPIWYDDELNAEQLKNDWQSFTLDQKLETWRSQDAYAEMKDLCKVGAPFERQDCALMIYVIFYDMFYRIYDGRVPRMSDILASTYFTELGTAFSQPSTAQDALAGNYFAFITQYCHDIYDIPIVPVNQVIIGIEDNGTVNCNPLGTQVGNLPGIPINDLVNGYEQPTVSGRQGGYLWTLHAWYHLGVDMMNWYYTELNLSNISIQAIDDIKDIITQQPQDKNYEDHTERLRLLLQMSRDYRIIGLKQLEAGRENLPRRTWGNYAFGYVDTRTNRVPYNDALANLNTLDFCILNLQYDANGAYEDVFIISLDGFGQTSVPQDGTTPDWVNTRYLTSEKIQQFRDAGGRLKCSCESRTEGARC